MNVEFLKEELKNHVTDFVKTEAKEASVLWIRDEALPAIREVSETYTAALKESSEQETGWCRFRDRVFLPCIVDAGLWIVGKTLESIIEKQSA